MTRMKLSIILAVLAITLVGCSSNTTNAPMQAAPTANNPVSTNEVTIQNFAFSPAQITVAVGTTVTWKQQDGVPHSIISDDGTFESKVFNKGETYSFTFSKAGTYTYHCGIHTSMKGTVIVQ